jgi:DNA repair protein RecO (recombination protein O)
MTSPDSRSYRAQGVVLRHMEYGEADRILSFYTLEYGKVQAIAKGIRKMRSRKAGHLEPFSRVELMLARGRNLDVISQAEAQSTYENLRADLKLIAYAAYVVELLDRFTYEEGENRPLYNLLVNTLTRLDEGSPAQTAIHYYEVQLMDLLGFKPQLQVCVACGEKIKPEDQFFSAKLGGVLCPKSLAADPGAWKVSLGALKYWRHLQRSSWSKVKNLEIPQEVESELASLLERYLTYLLEYGLRTPGFLKAVS